MTDGAVSGFVGIWATGTRNEEAHGGEHDDACDKGREEAGSRVWRVIHSRGGLTGFLSRHSALTRQDCASVDPVGKV